MDAWSPKIPLDTKNSAIPVIIFNFTVTNNTTNDATVGCFAAAVFQEKSGGAKRLNFPSILKETRVLNK